MYQPFLQDLQQMNQLYNRSVFSCLLLYGKDGVGKTRLIRSFCKEKHTLYITGREVVPSCLLSSARRELLRQLSLNQELPEFRNWAEFFAVIADYSFSRRLILVLDEFQFFTEQDPEFFSAFAHAIKNTLPAGRVFLVISTSSVAYAHQLLEQPELGIADRLMARSYMSKLSFFTARQLLQGYAPKDQVLLYGITGGMPANLELLDTSLTAQENVKKLFFRPDAPLLFQPLYLLHRELREVSTYNHILEIIASGTNRLADIADTAGIGTNKCAKYLNSLIALDLLQKEVPCIGDNSKKVRYIFSDHKTRFWYRHVYPCISSILIGQGDVVYEKEVVPVLYEYLSDVFEDICREYLDQLFRSRQAPFTYSRFGSWWKGGTKREPFYRIPLLACDAKQVMLGLCACSAAPAEEELLQRLRLPFEEIEGKNPYYCIFSFSGFSEALQQLEHTSQNIWLIDLGDM